MSPLTDPELVERLRRLPVSDLSSILLEVLRAKTAHAGSGSTYYQGAQFKILARLGSGDGSSGDRLSEVADGGFVDWSQKLLGNRKERMLISGLGVERLLAAASDR